MSYYPDAGWKIRKQRGRKRLDFTATKSYEIFQIIARQAAAINTVPPIYTTLHTWVNPVLVQRYGKGISVTTFKKHYEAMIEAGYMCRDPVTGAVAIVHSRLEVYD